MQIVQLIARLVGILLGAGALLWLVRVLRERIVGVLMRTAIRGNTQERENRAHTLASVFASAATITVVVCAALMLISEFGLDIKPLVGGAAVAGLAVAFGAQNLMKDYFAGFMILLENQFALNDQITVAGVSGTVERITLRITVLRDQEGTVHFIPNGQIAVVGNKSQGWARAIMEITVGRDVGEDRLSAPALDAIAEARNDPPLSDLILDGGEILGTVPSDKGVLLRFAVKTRTGKQSQIQAEILRRVKRKLVEAGIEVIA